MQPYVICFGFFDGVHLGHQVVLDKVKSLALKHQAKSLVYTFRERPSAVLQQKQTDYILCPVEKQARLQQLGIDHIEMVDFTDEIAQLTYEQFFENHLIKKRKVAVLVFGYDTTIGKNRQGTFENISKLAAKHGIATVQTPVKEAGTVKFSSTLVRKAIREGKLSLAAEILGYPYFFSATVVKGKQLGKQLGFPTANLHLTGKILPKGGVFGVKVAFHNQHYFGMMNIGNNPTIAPDNPVSLEVHLFDFIGNLYGTEITVTFLYKIRDEQKFLDLEALKQQLHQDKAYCLARNAKKALSQN